MSGAELPVNIVPELSAIASRPAPRSIRLAAPRLANEAKRAVDVGCGYMQGTRELLRHHEKVYAVDSAAQQTRIASEIEECAAHESFAGFKMWDEFKATRLRLGAAYVVNVLHTLPSRELRVQLLEAVRQNLRRDGFLLLDVPYYEHYYTGRMTLANAYADGYIFSQGAGKFTFYRFTSVDEMDEWAQLAGFRFDFRLTDNHHWVRIYRPVAASSSRATLGT